jgi:hypothetical protein
MSEKLNVATVKKGEVLFLLDSKIELMKKLLSIDERSELDYANKDMRELQEWSNGRVSARLCDLDTLKELRKYINAI